MGGLYLRDDEVVLTNPHSRGEYPHRLRRVTALVELDGKVTVMEFLTNNFEWSPATVADLYRCRWQIEVFFKQIKQTLQLCDFMGHSANAVRWQVWTALLLYVLLRFQAFLHGWHHSFTRLFTLLRGVVWDRFELGALLTFYGTAGERWRMRAQPEQGYLPGFAPRAVGQHPLQRIGNLSSIVPKFRKALWPNPLPVPSAAITCVAAGSAMGWLCFDFSSANIWPIPFYRHRGGAWRRGLWRGRCLRRLFPAGGNGGTSGA